MTFGLIVPRIPDAGLADAPDDALDAALGLPWSSAGRDRVDPWGTAHPGASAAVTAQAPARDVREPWELGGCTERRRQNENKTLPLRPAVEPAARPRGRSAGADRVVAPDPHVAPGVSGGDRECSGRVRVSLVPHGPSRVNVA